ncbi:MAG: 30S ribosomal protein S12 methylthiotransferase RimO [Oscillospiraceae bacterium]
MSVKVGMVSLGCPKNQVDAEHMLFNLRGEAFEIVSDAALSDVVIVNTCGFIESAKQEAIDTILEFCTLKQEGRIKAVIVTGCLAERYRDQILQEIPEVDAVLGIGANEQLCAVIRDVLQTKESIALYGEKEALDIDGGRILSTEPFYAYLKIAEGCDNRCTYCAIPGIRGKFRSRTIENILKEANWLAEHGVKELVLIAQDTTLYGKDLYGAPRIAELLEALCKIEGLKWIRTLYSYPEHITDALLDVIAREEKLVKYIDLPIQHCDDQILKRMNRPGGEESLRTVIAKIRGKIPGVVLRTTLITGFPGETAAQFERLAVFAREMRFDRLGCFAYSEEEGTPAAEFPDQIEPEERTRRAEIIMNEQLLTMEALNCARIGETAEVVVEGFDRLAECWFGRSCADAPEIDGKIFFTSKKKLPVGAFVRVKLTDVLDYDLLGESEADSNQP